MSLFFPKDEAPAQLLPDPGPQGPPGPTGPQGPAGAAGASTWDELTGKPSTFAPSAHKASHATGGSDALTPSDIGALPDAIVVSSAGTTEVNGTYTRGANQNGFAAWYKDNFQIFAFGPFGPSLFRWILSGIPFVGGGPSNNEFYSGDNVNAANLPLSPIGIPLVAGVGIAPAPTFRSSHTHAIADTTGLQSALNFSTAITSAAAPITAGSVGSAGSIRYDADYIYICTATNTWRRTAITSW